MYNRRVSADALVTGFEDRKAKNRFVNGTHRARSKSVYDAESVKNGVKEQRRSSTDSGRLGFEQRRSSTDSGRLGFAAHELVQKIESEREFGDLKVCPW